MKNKQSFSLLLTLNTMALMIGCATSATTPISPMHPTHQNVTHLSVSAKSINAHTINGQKNGQKSENNKINQTNRHTVGTSSNTSELKSNKALVDKLAQLRKTLLALQARAAKLANVNTVLYASTLTPGRYHHIPAKQNSGLKKLSTLFQSSYSNSDLYVASIDKTHNKTHKGKNSHKNLRNTSPFALSNSTRMNTTRSFDQSMIKTTLKINNKKRKVDSLWRRIRNGFEFPITKNARIETELNWYVNNQAYLDRTFNRAKLYLYFLLEQVEKHDVPAEIALLPVIESAFQPFAYSSSQASGLWQFIPRTGRSYGLKQNWWYDGRRDIIASTDAAIRYLKDLNDYFHNDWYLALAAYNCGKTAVQRAIRKNQKMGKPTDFWSLRLPGETRRYVPKLIALAAVVANPQRHNISLIPIADKPYLKKINIDGQIDLALAAKIANMSLDQFSQFNPAFNRWATDPQGPHHLLLPIDIADTFVQKLKVSSAEKANWARHKIRWGDSLSLIANRYDTTVKVLQQINNLSGSHIREGHDLLIPVAAKAGYFQKSSLNFQSRRAKYTKYNSDSDRQHTYVVKPGDTLWSTARKFGIHVERLASWNSLSAKDWIFVGQKLTILSRRAF